MENERWETNEITPQHKVRTYKEYHSVCPSSELGLPPTPHPQASVPTPPPFLGGGEHSLARKGLGESQFRRGAYTVVLFICTYFVLHSHCMSLMRASLPFISASYPWSPYSFLHAISFLNFSLPGRRVCLPSFSTGSSCARGSWDWTQSSRWRRDLW